MNPMDPIHVDPKAPGNSPLHPANVLAAPRVAAERDSILATHLTAAEREAGWGAEDWEEIREDMLDRVQATVDYLSARSGDSDVTPPSIVDLTGAAYQLSASDDGYSATWEPVDLEEDDGEDDGEPDDDYEQRTNAELEAMLRERDLPHSGVKADLVARLREDDARQDAEAETGGDDLEAALAELDAAKGAK